MAPVLGWFDWLYFFLFPGMSHIKRYFLLYNKYKSEVNPFAFLKSSNIFLARQMVAFKIQIFYGQTFFSWRIYVKSCIYYKKGQLLSFLFRFSFLLIFCLFVFPTFYFRGSVALKRKGQEEGDRTKMRTCFIVHFLPFLNTVLLAFSLSPLLPMEASPF